MQIKKLSPEEFNRIYHTVPRSVVDLVVKTEEGILLSKRAIPPFKGMWHTPGGTVLFKEPLVRAVERVAQEELGVKVKIEGLLGVAECLDDGGKHTISNVFAVSIVSGEIRPDSQSQGLKFFKKLPSNTIPFQKKFLQENI